MWMIHRIALYLVLSVVVVQANGGGYFRGGVEKAGDLAGFEPKETDKIRMLDEKLTITLGPKSADVEVRYVMKNVTDKKVKVRFGFPVEESFDNDYMSSEIEKKRQDGGHLAYCRNYEITAAGKPIKAKWEKETPDSKANPEFKGVKGWLLSEVTFSPNEEKPVWIRFQSDYPLDEFGVSDDGMKSAAVFRYRLSSAACWAGSIGTGRIVLEPKGIDPNELRVIKPANRFKKEGDRWIWNFEELEPTLADDIEIEARPKEYEYGGRSYQGKYPGRELESHQYVSFIDRGGKWSMEHANYRVKASSTLKADGEITYVPENLRERWSDNAWSEGAEGPGVGEWLELTPEEAKPLLMFRIKPGYQKKGLFKANARPRKVRIELNGEHAFVAEMPDLEEEMEIPVDDYTKPVRKVRMTFLEVYPGEKYEDMCVSSVRLRVKLEKKPKVQPAR